MDTMKYDIKGVSVDKWGYTFIVEGRPVQVEGELGIDEWAQFLLGLGVPAPEVRQVLAEKMDDMADDVDDPEPPQNDEWRGWMVIMLLALVAAMTTAIMVMVL